MRGEKPTIPDINLELQEIVTAVDLHCNEILSPNEALPEPPAPYKVGGSCYACGSALRLFLVASQEGIRDFQQLLLLSHLSILCVSCAKTAF